MFLWGHFDDDVNKFEGCALTRKYKRVNFLSENCDFKLSFSCFLENCVKQFVCNKHYSTQNSLVWFITLLVHRVFGVSHK